MSELSPLRPGDPRELAGYRLVGRLGEGGQGTVYLAEGPSGDPVAIKLLHARKIGDAQARTRFAREVSATHASGTIIVPSSDNCTFPPYAVIHAVAIPSQGQPSRVAVFVVIADRNVDQAVPDQTLQQIIGSLRPARS